jgi:amino acid adenylation domain-containing protein
MLGHFQTLLQGIVSDPDTGIADLPLLTEVERHQLLVEWNDTKRNYPQNQCIHQLFEQQVELTPDAIALIFENQKLTYRELNERANKVAHYLKTLGVKPEVLVGICMERSLEMVIGILAIAKAGGAYVPLDPTYPKERLAFMLADAQVSVLLVQPHLVQELPPHQAQVVCIDSECQEFAAYSPENPTSEVTAENLAYVIYTSGSTGKPKGVQISHRAVVNFLMAMRQTPGLTEQDILLSVTTLSFDIAALEIYLPLTVGAQVVIVSRQEISDGIQLSKSLNSCGATVMQATPATWRMLLAVGWTGNQQLKILCGGEALDYTLAQQLQQRGKEVWNLYGPTETTIWSSVSQVNTQNKPQNNIAIGSPIANTQFYILDQYCQLVPIGVVGELHIGGAGLARGYLNKPELTQQRFISSPFESGKYLYKTGDLARYRSDGSIEYLGRIDHQVKIRGFRIELGEIEAVLKQHPKIRETVVIVREDIPKNQRLVAYVIPHSEMTFSMQELRDYLKDKLPDYMVPSTFVELDTLPLTPNGKIDRRALPVPDEQRPDLKEVYEAPKSEVERAIAKIWLEILRVEKVGVNDNFFDLGGNSLLMVQVNHKLREIMHCDISIVEMFQNPTIKYLAKYINISSKQTSVFESLNNRIQKQREAVNRQKSLIKRGKKLNN